jgi:hypothetical protein
MFISNFVTEYLSSSEDFSLALNTQVGVFYIFGTEIQAEYNKKISKSNSQSFMRSKRVRKTIITHVVQPACMLPPSSNVD